MGAEDLDQPTEVHVTLRVPRDFRRRLRKAAAHVSMPVSRMIRVVMREWMETNGLWDLRGPDRDPRSKRWKPTKVRLEEEDAYE